MPAYLHLTPVGVKVKYDYDNYDDFHKIQYLPDSIKDIEFVSFNHNKYEEMLKHNYEELKKTKRSNDLGKIYKK